MRIEKYFLYITLTVVFSSYAEDALKDTSNFNKKLEGKKQGLWEKNIFFQRK